MMKITLKDGSVKEYAESKSVYDIALDISEGLARAACAGEINGEVRIRTKAEDDKMLIEEIEDMFSGYEMSIELQKLNIPKKEGV